MFEVSRRGLAAFVSAFAILGAGFSAGPVQAQEKPVIKVSSLTLPVFNPLVWNIMKAKGFDAKHGFTLDIHAFPSIAAFYAAFATGETDVLIGGPTVYQKLYAQGVPLRIIGSGFTLGDLVIFAKDPNIKSLADLKGKQLAIDMGGSQYQMVKIYCAAKSIDLGKDITVVNANFAVARADQHRVVLGAPGQDLDHPLDLGLAPDHRVELALAGQLGQVASELVEHRGLRALLRARVVLIPQEGQRLLPDLVQPGAERLEDLRGDGLPFLHQAEQEVLGPDVVVSELTRFLDRQLEHALGLRGERHLAEGQGLGEPGQRPLDFGLDGLQPEAEPLEHRSRDALAVTDQSEEDVLGPDEVMTEPPGLFPGQDDDPTRPLRESLEHCG